MTVKYRIHRARVWRHSEPGHVWAYFLRLFVLQLTHYWWFFSTHTHVLSLTDTLTMVYVCTPCITFLAPVQKFWIFLMPVSICAADFQVLFYQRHIIINKGGFGWVDSHSDCWQLLKVVGYQRLIISYPFSHTCRTSLSMSVCDLIIWYSQSWHAHASSLAVLSQA